MTISDAPNLGITHWWL